MLIRLLLGVAAFAPIGAATSQVVRRRLVEPPTIPLGVHSELKVIDSQKKVIVQGGVELQVAQQLEDASDNQCEKELYEMRKSKSKSNTMARDDSSMSKRNPVHYFRIPKTGSTSSKCALRMCDDFVEYHDHGDGCGTVLENPKYKGTVWSQVFGYIPRYEPSDLATTKCNATYVRTLFPDAEFKAVIRDPCQRFASVYEHLARAIRVKWIESNTLGQPWTDHTDLLDWINSTTQHCRWSGNDVDDTHCFVKAISDNFTSPHRVVLWPQAMFLEAQSKPICYNTDVATFNDRMKSSFSNWCEVFKQSEPLNNFNYSREIAPSTCARVLELYRMDARWWSTFCEG
jgi:hypothetical protein